jgi:hypothetical protein
MVRARGEGEGPARGRGRPKAPPPTRAVRPAGLPARAAARAAAPPPRTPMAAATLPRPFPASSLPPLAPCSPQLRAADGVLVPGGFGGRGVEGKIAAAHYARTNKVPYLGICLGMQVGRQRACGGGSRF